MKEEELRLFIVSPYRFEAIIKENNRLFET